MDEGGGGVGEGGSVDRSLSAGGGDVGDDGISAHGEAADGISLNVVSFEKLKDGMAGESAALGVERGGAAVDVIVAGGAGGECEGAEAETEAGEVGEEMLGVGWGGHRF